MVRTMTTVFAALAWLFAMSIWSSFDSGEALWLLDRSDLKVLGAIAAAFIASALVSRKGEDTNVVQLGMDRGIAVVAFVGATIILLSLRNVEMSKQFIVAALCAAVGIALLEVVLRKHRAVLAGLLVVLVLAALALDFAVARGTFDESVQHGVPRYIASHHFGIEATSYSLPSVVKPGGGIPTPPRGYNVLPGGGIREGGGIIALREGYLLVSGAGDFYTFTRPGPGENLIPNELDIQVPINAQAFKQAVGHDTAVRYWNFRVQDVQVAYNDDGASVFVSHHYWLDDRACYVVRVSVFDVAGGDLPAYRGEANWRTLFESQPCLPIKKFDRGQRFAGEESGGKLAMLDEATLLLTLGDHEFDGLNADVMLAQDPDASYGKIIAIEVAKGASTNFSVGHRNPQGLFVASDGGVWSTEHGPEGGDELNRVDWGNNHGWPLASYGVDYGLHSWPLTEDVGSHAGYVEPIYAWVPSIGVSNLIGVEQTQFDAWRGDLLVASLRDRGMWRMRIRNGGLVVNERIDIGLRIRDIIEGHDGEVVLWCDEKPEIVFLEPAGDRKTKDAAFAVCRGCHTISGSASAIGPNLTGVIGREIGAYPDYRYSNGFASLDGRWSEESLDAFLQNPQAFAPGTSMALPGIQDAAERKLVIDYLKGL